MVAEGVAAQRSVSRSGIKEPLRISYARILQIDASTAVEVEELRRRNAEMVNCVY